MKYLVTIVLIFMLSPQLIAQQNVQIYYPSGELKAELIKMPDNEIAFQYYWENGKIKETGFLKDGVKNRIWKEWNESGQIRSQANFEKGKKHGRWIIYDGNGILKYAINYENDFISNAYEYDQSGEVIAYK